MSKYSRREFSRLISIATAATAVAPIGAMHARVARAESCENLTSFSHPGFGPLEPTLPENTAELGDVPGRGDLRNLPLLSLPAGFAYTAVSIRGQVMTDGVLVPGDHDGMAAFQGRGGNTLLVRNHELSIVESENGNFEGALAPNGKQYDPFQNAGAGLGGGGTTTLEIDGQGRLVSDHISLGGTIRNCAGGPTPWRSWISCEENVSTPATDDRATVRHGYNFEVPADLTEAVEPIPLVDMGRMNHEAVSVDRTTGYVYETEDRGDSAYYRFVPRQQGRGFGVLQAGGDLYAMAIKPNQRSACGTALPLSDPNGTGTMVVDTRGLDRGAPESFLPFLGQPLAVEWVRLDDVDPVEDTLRVEAQSKGASLWWRGEGAWEHKGLHYWVASGAGDLGEGQVWCYDPLTETVTLLVESTDEDLLDGPDNITVARDGTLYLCEDGSTGTPGQGNFSEKVVGVAADGGLFDLTRNLLDTSEFAGACFSPNGRQMFVNSQGVGITYVIWRRDNRPIYLNTGWARNRR